jgi:ribosomal peptide maturation radical SAM protein 1
VYPVIPIRLEGAPPRPNPPLAPSQAPARGIASAGAGAPLRVVLINLPWASFRRPSIQIGLLGSLARADGHEAELAHLNLELAAQIGTGLYDAIAEHRSTALGDWLFARAAFPATAPAPEPFLARYGDAVGALLARAGSSIGLADLLRFHEYGAEQFLRRQIGQHDWSQAQLFGLTSTFQQNNACFAMARLLKEIHPGCTVVAGGANFDGEMGGEWLRAVPAIDLVVSGEADVAFTALLGAMRDGLPLAGVPNLIRRVSLSDGIQILHAAPQAPFDDLDSLPLPDYDEYFMRAEKLGLLAQAARRDIDIPVETSRGCWWGERRHCTFCGLNGETMAYRSKSGQRVLTELSALAKRHRSFRFTAVDNILNLKFHKSLFPVMAEQGLTYNLFYEVKSGASPDRLKEMRAAGVVRIQPGIESLSTNVLKLMNKGVKAIANVNLLRWCRILHIDVSWNLIWGFPGETEDDYRSQLELLPRLAHLQPPLGAGRIWLERFSPLYQQRCGQSAPMRPEESLHHVYPAGVDLLKAAYFFEYDFDVGVPAAVYAELAATADEWRSAAAASVKPQLEYRYADGFLQIDDRRFPDAGGIYTFEDEYALLYASMVDAPVTIVEAGAKSGLAGARLGSALEQFCAHGLAMRDGDQVLALALPHRVEGRSA